MTRSTVGAGLALIGVALLVGSFFVSAKGIAGRYWTKSDALQLNQLGLEAKRLAHDKSHGLAVSQTQVEQAMAAHRAKRERLDRASRWGDRVVLTLRGLGLLSVLVATGLVARPATDRARGRRGGR